MPCYDVLAGAKTIEGDAHLAERIGTVPAKRIPDMLAEAFATGAIEKQQLKNVVQEYGDFASVQFPDDYYYDYGSSEPFSLAGRGPGECGAGVMDVIKVDIDEAKEAIKAAAKAKEASGRSDCLYKAIVAAARTLLVIFGLEPKKDREIFAAFSKHLIEPAWVKPQTQQLLDEVIDWRMGNRDSIDDLLPEVEDLAKRVEELFLSLDANLRFKIKPIVQKTNIDKTETRSHTIDLQGVDCPLNFVKAKVELEKVAVGEILEVLLDDGEPARNVPESFTEQGQEVIEVKNVGDHFCVKVRRKK
jgi:sulfite reductase (ferredoxin)